MQKVIINAAAYRLLLDLKRGGEVDSFESGSRQLKDGSWEIDIGEDVLEVVQKKAFPGETLSDTIVRMVDVHKGKKAN